MLNAARLSYYDEELIARSFRFLETSLARAEGGARCTALITVWRNPRIRRDPPDCCIDYAVIRGCHGQ